MPNKDTYIIHMLFLLCNTLLGDLNASEITMSDDQRIELMIQVKEGKISMHDAVELVRTFFFFFCKRPEKICL